MIPPNDNHVGGQNECNDQSRSIPSATCVVDESVPGRRAITIPHLIQEDGSNAPQIVYIVPPSNNRTPIYSIPVSTTADSTHSYPHLSHKSTRWIRIYQVMAFLSLIYFFSSFIFVDNRFLALSGVGVSTYALVACSGEYRHRNLPLLLIMQHILGTIYFFMLLLFLFAHHTQDDHLHSTLRIAADIVAIIILFAGALSTKRLLAYLDKQVETNQGSPQYNTISTPQLQTTTVV